MEEIYNKVELALYVILGFVLAIVCGLVLGMLIESQVILGLENIPEYTYKSIAGVISIFGVISLYSISKSQNRQIKQQQEVQLETQKQLLYYEMVWSELKQVRSHFIDTVIPEVGNSINILIKNKLEEITPDQTETYQRILIHSYNNLDMFHSSFKEFVDEEKFEEGISSLDKATNEIRYIGGLEKRKETTLKSKKDQLVDLAEIFNKYVEAYEDVLESTLKEIMKFK